MSARYVAAPDAAEEYVLRDVLVVDVADSSHAMSGDCRVVAQEDHAHRRDPGRTQQRWPSWTAAARSSCPATSGGHARALGDVAKWGQQLCADVANGVAKTRQMSSSRDTFFQGQQGVPAAPAPGAPRAARRAQRPARPAERRPAARRRGSRGAPASASEAPVGSKRGMKLTAWNSSPRSPKVSRLSLSPPTPSTLPGDVNPREAARGGMRCIDRLGPGVAVFAAIPAPARLRPVPFAPARPAADRGQAGQQVEGA